MMAARWDAEADVVVIGYGAAGAVASIVARDAGARVILVEKAQYPGGLSILSAGFIKCAKQIDKAVQYLTHLSGDRVAPELVQTFAEGLVGNEAFIQELAKNDGAKLRTASSGAVYPLPGRDAFHSITIGHIPNFQNFPWLHGTLPAGVRMFKMLMDNIAMRDIEVWLSCPALELITDSQGAVIGVVAEREGQEVMIKGQRAVILASGGFEQDPWMQQQYLQAKPFFSLAPLTHSGDGIRMAQKVGSALWHMWHIHGSYGLKFPEFPAAFRHPFSGKRKPDRKMPWILVDQFGNRYMNEYHPAPQDTGHRPMELLDPELPDFPRIPSYLIFDEEGRQQGRIAAPLGFGQGYQWSADNTKEIERGWILKADTIRKLSSVIRSIPENKARMDPDLLECTIEQWNQYMNKREDPLGRPPNTMMPIITPPFYAAQAWPIITNTQGGPVHNSNQQVMDVFGHPIPHLYAVGELGSFFGHLYELGGNLGECFISGRIAGATAAAEKGIP